MGFDTLADHGVDIEALVAVVDMVKQDALHAESQAKANRLWKFGGFLTTVTACGLRGYEGYYTDLAGLRAHLHKGKDGELPRNITKNSILSEKQCKKLPHVSVCLLGNFKGEGGINQHMINVASETQSGLEPRFWIEKVVEVAESEGRFFGPAFADEDGNLIAPGDFDALFREYLKRVQSETDLIDDDINVDVMYSLSRTPRKSALTRAKRAGLGKEFQEDMNRWKKIEKAKGRRPRHNMRQLYSEAVLLMPTTWLYSYVL